MEWTDSHRSFAVETYFKTQESISLTLKIFRNHFKLNRNVPLPAHRTIRRWVQNFRSTSSAKKKKPTGKPRSIRTPENIQIVKEAALKSPSRSARSQANALKISDRSVRRMLNFDLKFHPYKIQVVQELTENDLANRWSCSEKILRFIRSKPNAVIMTSDEAHFHLSGTVNKQNFRYWAEHNPRELHQKPLHSKRVTVWCAVGNCGIWGPYFFEENGQTTTVTSDRYTEMLRTFVKPKTDTVTDHQIIFQQDGATSHTARQSMEVLKEMFPGCLISIRRDVPWPARSPDLAPCDFFLWGHLKAKVFAEKPRTIQELKAVIRQKIEEIPQEMIEKVMENFRKRLQLCINLRGHHLKDIIF